MPESIVQDNDGLSVTRKPSDRWLTVVTLLHVYLASFIANKPSEASHFDRKICCNLLQQTLPCQLIQSVSLLHHAARSHLRDQRHHGLGSEAHVMHPSITSCLVLQSVSRHTYAKVHKEARSTELWCCCCLHCQVGRPQQLHQLTQDAHLLQQGRPVRHPSLRQVVQESQILLDTRSWTHGKFIYYILSFFFQQRKFIVKLQDCCYTKMHDTKTLKHTRPLHNQ